jgi:hypothetical protein
MYTVLASLYVLFGRCICSMLDIRIPYLLLRTCFSVYIYLTHIELELVTVMRGEANDNCKVV